MPTDKVLYIDVIKWFEVRGDKGLKLPFYQIFDGSDEELEEFFRSLLEKGVEECIYFAVQAPYGIVDVEKNIISYPKWGIKRHITEIMSNKDYGKVTGRDYYNIRRYLEDV